MKILKLNRGLLFLLLVTPWIISYYYPFEDPNNHMTALLFNYLVLAVWFVLLDQELMKRMPKKIEISNTLFYINIFLIISIFSVYYIFGKAGEEYKVTGIAAIPFLYYFYAVYQIYNHLSKLLTYVEEDKEVQFSKRVGEMVMFFFFFIGVWWLQPRIIKALEKPEVVHEKYISMREREAMNEMKDDNQTESL